MVPPKDKTNLNQVNNGATQRQNQPQSGYNGATQGQNQP